MVLLEKTKAAVESAADGFSELRGFSGVQGIAVFMWDGELPDENSQVATILRGIATLGARFDAGALRSEIFHLPDLSLAKKRPEGVVDAQLQAFLAYIGNSRANKTAQGYFYDTRNVLSQISREYFNDILLDKLNLSEITVEQVQQAEISLFKNSGMKPATLARLKQGWNRFCIFIGAEEWKFSYVLNATYEYKDDVISNDEIREVLSRVNEVA